MVFYCKDCDTEFTVDNEESKGYYNWKCPECYHIAPLKDMTTSSQVVWKCDTGTVKRNAS